MRTLEKELEECKQRSVSPSVWSETTKRCEDLEEVIGKKDESIRRLSEEIDYLRQQKIELERDNESLRAELGYLNNRGFWARVFNK